MRAWIVSLSLVGFSTPAIAQAMDLPAPTPEGVSVRVGASENGQTIDVSAGGQIAIELQGSAGTGAWVLSEAPAALGTPATFAGPARAGAGGRPLLGAPQWQVWVFDAPSPGVGDLVFTKIGPARGGDSTPAETFRVTIVAH